MWTPQLVELGHDVAIAAFHGLQGAPINWSAIPTYPGSTEDPWAMDLLPAYYQLHKADMVITLMDAWVLDPSRLQGMRVVHWLPLDAAPLSSMDKRVLDAAGGTPIAMSLFGQKLLENAGFEEVLYVPHGVDTEVFKPQEDREEIRERLGFKDKYVVGIVAANQDPIRKGFPEQMAAFSVFHKNHPEAMLMIHSRAESRQGVELNRIAADLGILDAVRYGDQLLIAAGMVSDADMAKLYSALDVLSNCSFGEGFGLPILEAQACGTPVVVTDFSSMTEMCGSGALVYGDSYWNRGHNAWWMRPAVPSIVDAYERVYANFNEGSREAAREFALEFDVKRVLAEFWEPALKKLEEMDA